jgi:hypothetical protein
LLTGNEPGNAEGLCGLDFQADFVVFWEEVVDALLLFLEEEDMVRVARCNNGGSLVVAHTTTAARTMFNCVACVALVLLGLQRVMVKQ